MRSRQFAKAARRGRFACGWVVAMQEATLRIHTRYGLCFRMMVRESRRKIWRTFLIRSLRLSGQGVGRGWDLVSARLCCASMVGILRPRRRRGVGQFLLLRCGWGLQRAARRRRKARRLRHLFWVQSTVILPVVSINPLK